MHDFELNFGINLYIQKKSNSLALVGKYSFYNKCKKTILTAIKVVCLRIFFCYELKVWILKYTLQSWSMVQKDYIKKGSFCHIARQGSQRYPLLAVWIFICKTSGFAIIFASNLDTSDPKTTLATWDHSHCTIMIAILIWKIVSFSRIHGFASHFPISQILDISFL